MHSSVSDIVDMVMADMGESSTHIRQRLLHFAIRGVKQLNLNSLFSFKEALLPIKSNLAVDIPNDCVRYVQVGFLHGDKVVLLTEDSNLPTIQNTDDCGNPEALTADSVDSTYNYLWGYYASLMNFNYPYGQNVGKYFGYLTKNRHGYFVHDKANNQLIFSSIAHTNLPIYMKYVSNGIGYDGNTTVPQIAEEALMAFIHKEYVINTPAKQRESQMREQRYNIESMKLRAATRNFTLRDFILSGRKDFKATPRN